MSLTEQAREASSKGKVAEALSLYKESLASLFQLKDSLPDTSEEKKNILQEIEILLKEAEKLKAKASRDISVSSSTTGSAASSRISSQDESPNGTISLRILGHRITNENVTRYGVEVLIQGGPLARTICGLPSTGQDERWILEKRYSQFEAMSKALKSESTNAYIESNVKLPKKNFVLFGKDSEEFVKERTQGLAIMLDTIQSNSQLVFTRALGHFLSGNIDDIKQRETMQHFLKRRAMEQNRMSGGQDEMRKARLARMGLRDKSVENENVEKKEEAVEDLNQPPTNAKKKRTSGLFNLKLSLPSKDDLFKIGQRKKKKEITDSLPSNDEQNRIKTIHSSLKIEGNTLSVEQITALLENKRVIGPKKDIKEVLIVYV